MATIISVIEVIAPGTTREGTYDVEIQPHAGRPGEGVVRDAHGRTKPWESASGDVITVRVSGTPPFQVEQTIVSALAWPKTARKS